MIPSNTWEHLRNSVMPEVELRGRQGACLSCLRTCFDTQQSERKGKKGGRKEIFQPPLHPGRNRNGDSDWTQKFWDLWAWVVMRRKDKPTLRSVSEHLGSDGLTSSKELKDRWIQKQGGFFWRDCFTIITPALLATAQQDSSPWGVCDEQRDVQPRSAPLSKELRVNLMKKQKQCALEQETWNPYGKGRVLISVDVWNSYTPLYQK